MNTPVSPERYFYHCFPRPRSNSAGQEAKGLRILRSIIKNGFLLTPEKVEWPREFREKGERGSQVVGWQKRICFTELAPREIGQHMAVFGPFALEFEISALRHLGAMPVFYVPIPGEAEVALDGIGAAFITRIAEIRLVFDRIRLMAESLSANPNSLALLELVTHKGVRLPSRCSAAAATDLLRWLIDDVEAPRALEATLRAFSALFYPTEREVIEALQYYRQREWRILADFAFYGEPVDRLVTMAEANDLLKLDSDFFGKTLDFPAGVNTIARESRYMREDGGRHVFTYARRILVPRDALGQARAIVCDGGFTVPVEAFAGESAR